jgi:hypothetical protein
MSHAIVSIIANQKRGGARRSTKRRGGQRDGRPQGNGVSSLVRSAPPATLCRIPGVGFPNAMLANVRYHDTYAISSTVGSVGKQLIRWNSTFDPDYSGVGHQPLYRDTYTSIYDHYVVVSASVEIKFSSTGTSSFIVGCLTDDDASTSSTVNTLCEQATGQSVLLPPIAGSLSTCTLRMSWDCKKVLGFDPFKSELAKTPAGSDPAEDSFLVIWAATTDSTTAAIACTVTLVQHVLWTELSTPTQS